MLQPVIIAGGSGTRLERDYPKQFLALTGDKSMLELTVERLADLNCAPPIVVCNEDQLEQCASPAGIVLEAGYGTGYLPGSSSRSGNKSSTTLLILPKLYG